jgi:secondary thiamine-phosphate synthase enzyme
MHHPITTITLRTEKEGITDITGRVRSAVREAGVADGACLVFCPHTTAAVTINENADPDVGRDIMLGLAKAFPDRQEFRHAEGNSAAHLKASCIGSSVTVPIEGGDLVLGTWQGIQFYEFDGPRQRSCHVKVMGLRPGEGGHR